MVTTSTGTGFTNTLTNSFSGLNQQPPNNPQNVSTGNSSGNGNRTRITGADPNLQILATIMENLTMNLTTNQNQQLSQILQQQSKMQQQSIQQPSTVTTTISGSIRAAVSNTSASIVRATQLANFDKLPILKGRESLYEVKTFFHRFETFAQGQAHNESLNILQTKYEGYALHIFEEAHPLVLGPSALLKLGIELFDTYRNKSIEFSPLLPEQISKRFIQML